MSKDLNFITNAKGVGPTTLEKFKDSGINNVEDLENMDKDDIVNSVDGVGHSTVESIIQYVDENVSSGEDSKTEDEYHRNLDEDFVSKSEYEKDTDRLDESLDSLEYKVDNIKEELREELKEEVKEELKEEVKEELKYDRENSHENHSDIEQVGDNDKKNLSNVDEEVEVDSEELTENIDDEGLKIPSAEESDSDLTLEETEDTEDEGLNYENDLNDSLVDDFNDMNDDGLTAPSNSADNHSNSDLNDKHETEKQTETKNESSNNGDIGVNKAKKIIMRIEGYTYEQSMSEKEIEKVAAKAIYELYNENDRDEIADIIGPQLESEVHSFIYGDSSDSERSTVEQDTNADDISKKKEENTLEGDFKENSKDDTKESGGIASKIIGLFIDD